MARLSFDRAIGNPSGRSCASHSQPLRASHAFDERRRLPVKWYRVNPANINCAFRFAWMIGRRTKQEVRTELARREAARPVVSAVPAIYAFWAARTLPLPQRPHLRSRSPPNPLHRLRLRRWRLVQLHHLTVCASASDCNNHNRGHPGFAEASGEAGEGRHADTIAVRAVVRLV